MSGYNCSEVGDKSGFHGCGRTFSALKYFDSHFVKVTGDYDETRDVETVGVDGSRCMTNEELINNGLEQRENGVWHDPEITEMAKNI